MPSLKLPPALQKLVSALQRLVDRLDLPAHPVASRRACVAALVLVTLLICNALLGWALIPCGSKTDLVWQDYHALQELDTVVTGSECAQQSIDPSVLDATLGSHSFNLGTPNQSLACSYAALQSAIDDWHVRHAILCLDYDTLFEEPSAQDDIAFLTYKKQQESPLRALRDTVDLMGSDYYLSRHFSLTRLFPWAYNHVPLTAEGVSTNIENRLTGNVHAAARSYAKLTGDTSWDYERTGFVGLRGSLKGECTHRYDYAPHKDDEVKADVVESLLRIFELCAQNDVKLYVVVPPTAASVLIANAEAYPERMGALQELAAQHGATFFDLNLAKPDVLKLDGSELSDLTHLSAAGAANASTALAKLIVADESNGDVYDSLYSYDADGWRSYLASVTYVDSVDYTVTRRNGNALIEAKARTGSQGTVMYQFETRSSQGGTWKVARAWDLSPSFELRLPANKSVELRLSARTLQNEEAIRWVKGVVAR
ncbi:MAG: hypothetical protein J6S63_08325 [Atopobiaceae bacterium]|nr:hypothetical protein [Atopobiaceae bacterium]